MWYKIQSTVAYSVLFSIPIVEIRVQLLSLFLEPRTSYIEV